MGSGEVTTLFAGLLIVILTFIMQAYWNEMIRCGEKEKSEKNESQEWKKRENKARIMLKGSAFATIITILVVFLILFLKVDDIIKWILTFPLGWILLISIMQLFLKNK